MGGRKTEVAGEPDLSQACAVPASGHSLLAWARPFLPCCSSPQRAALGPWNMLSPSAAVGMMERQVIFNSGDSLWDRASSSLGKETSREGGDPNSRCSCLIPALPSLSPTPGPQSLAVDCEGGPGSGGRLRPGPLLEKPWVWKLVRAHVPHQACPIWLPAVPDPLLFPRL